MKYSNAEKAKAKADLLEFLKPGDVVHCILRSVSRSGMSRRISFLKILENGNEIMLDRKMAILGIGSFKEHGDGLKIGGCGMDMGFAAVYELSCALWPDGFGCVGEKCPSNDHSNGDRSYVEHGRLRQIKWPDEVKAGASDYVEHWHKSAGYALKHKWL